MSKELVLEKYKQNLLREINKGNSPTDRDDNVVPIQSISFEGLKPALPCGIKLLDDMFLGGFRDGQLVIISGLSGHGKTTLSMQITKQYSIKAVPVVWISYEMSINEMQWKFQQMGGYEELMCYTPKKHTSENVKWLEEKVIEAISVYDCKIVFVDNLDFLTIDKQEGDDKLTAQKRIVGMLKRIAIEYDIIIFLNAHTTKLEDGKEPRMQNLYGASEVYKLADAVIFIHRLREKVGRGEQELEFTDESKIIVDKNRLNGKTGSIKVVFKNNMFQLLDNVHEDLENINNYF
jgi:replicative DNA helicase